MGTGSCQGKVWPTGAESSDVLPSKADAVMATARSGPEVAHSGPVHLCPPMSLFILQGQPRCLTHQEVLPTLVRSGMHSHEPQTDALGCTALWKVARPGLHHSPGVSQMTKSSPSVTLIVSAAPGATPSPPITLSVPWQPSPPTAGHSHDLWEGQLQKHLLLLVHEVDARPVDSHDDITLGEGRAWDSDRGPEKWEPLQSWA